jgi:Right handed beta helix region
MQLMRRAFLAAAFVLTAGPALAGDGRIEINQASVNAAGGFPFVISQPGSYVLTGDLVSQSAAVDGIQISASGVTLDLNGFTVRGPNGCSAATFYEPSSITCTMSGSGDGIVAGNAVVRNGHVSGWGRYGVVASGSYTAPTTVEDLHVEQNAQGGIYVNDGTVRRVRVTLNGGDGIANVAGGDANVAITVEDSQIVMNFGDGVGLAGKIRNCRITYNGGAGVIHNNAGGKTSLIADSIVTRNDGNAISAYGSYRDNEIAGNGTAGGGQVIGGMTDTGGNNVH